MIFLTVGTQFPFDRLVEAIDKAAGDNGFDDEIFAQIGNSSYRPRNFKAEQELEKSVFDEHLTRADGVISHAGMGTITLALEHKKPLLVMPRLRKYREAVNDHQLAIAKEFEKLRHLLVAYDASDIPMKIEELRSFVPRERRPQSQRVAARISTFLSEISGAQKSSARG
jgi:UDP-N-acetylglucosamine transferase subunit ALG13